MTLRNQFGELALDASLKALGTNPAAPLFVAPSTAGAVSASRFRMGTSGRIALNVAGNLRCTVRNATATDGGTAFTPRPVQLVRMAVFATGTGYASIYVNPTTGLPASSTRRPKVNPIFTSSAMDAPTAPSASDPIDVRVDVNATTPLSGGEDPGVVFGIPANQRTTLDLPPFILAPGAMLGINVPFAGAADVTMSLYYVVV